MEGVVLNGRCLLAPVTGVERYTRELLSRLDGLRVVCPRRRSGALGGHVWEQLRLPRLTGDALLWSPANSGPLAVARQVVTIHDVSPLEHPEWFRPAFSAWYQYLMPRLARRSRCVITNSAYSRSRIVRLLGLAADRVHAIPLGVSPAFRPALSGERLRVASALGLRRPYFLAVGSLQPRKNLAGVFRAWERSGMSAHADLVIAGTDGRTFRGRGFDAIPAAAYFAGSRGDDDLPALYSGAVALVLLSLYEGFGLPMVEAMACGTPVIASNVTALPEVAGAAALLVDPTDPDAVAAALADVWQSVALREELGGRGLERARAFSWERAAEETRVVLERARD